jgi:hypothetical protein
MRRAVDEHEFFPQPPLCRSQEPGEEVHEGAPGDGLSRLFGHHSPGAAVLGAARGSRSTTGIAGQGLPVSEREVHPEELAPSPFNNHLAIDQSAVPRVYLAERSGINESIGWLAPERFLEHSE